MKWKCDTCCTSGQFKPCEYDDKTVTTCTPAHCPQDDTVEANWQEVAEFDESVEAELNTLRDLERSYTQQLGEMARLSDVVCKWVIGEAGHGCCPDDVIDAVGGLIEYVEAVRPPEGSKDPEWVVHILGPDDVIDCVSQFDALRQANEINKAYARMCADDPSPNNPHCWAVVKNRAAEEV